MYGIHKDSASPWGWEQLGSLQPCPEGTEDIRELDKAEGLLVGANLWCLRGLCMDMLMDPLL